MFYLVKSHLKTLIFFIDRRRFIGADMVANPITKKVSQISSVQWFRSLNWTFQINSTILCKIPYRNNNAIHRLATKRVTKFANNYSSVLFCKREPNINL